MKYLYSLTLLAAALCLTLPTQAQNVEVQDDQKVIIIKKTINEDGQVNVEKIVTTKAEAGELELDQNVQTIDVIKFGDVNTDADMHEINVEVETDGEHQTIWITHDGEEEIIELKKGEELSQEMKEKLEKEGIHMWNIDESFPAEDGIGNRVHELTERIARFDFHPRDMHRAHVARVREHSNCVALGVFVSSSDGGAKVSRTIDGSGAEEAGLASGDVITAINEIEVTSVSSLHEALSKYEPGDVVKVTYDREGQSQQLSSELRAWGQLPDYKDSWRANIKCGDENYKEEFNFLAAPQVTKKVIIIKKGQDNVVKEEETPAVNEIESVNDYTLQLENLSVFPNPNDGKFRIQFEGAAKPVTVSVFDASGREVYRDNMSDFNGFYNKEVDLSNKLRGQAVVSIAQEGKRHSELLIIQ